MVLGFGVAMLAMPVQAQMFTTANGYVDGQLQGQKSWQWGGTNYQVNTTTGVVNANVASTGLQAAYWASGWTPLTTTGYIATTSTDFRMSLSGVTPTGINGIWGVGLTNNGNFRAYGSLRFFSGNYGFELNQQNTGGGSVSTAKYFDPTALGLNSSGGDYDSDLLRITTTLTRGADENGWYTTSTLLNVTTGVTVASVTGSFTTSATVFTQNNSYSWYAQDYMQNIDQAGLSSLSMINVNQVLVSAPEPGSVALLGLGLLMLGRIGQRRYQKR